MNKKIVITGMGAVTPLGVGTAAFLDGIKEGRCGIREITKVDTAELQVHNAGEVSGFEPKKYLPTRLVKDLEPYMQYAYVAAEEAIKDSGLDTASERVGITMGSALSGIAIEEKTGQDHASKGRPAGPKYLLKAMGNIAAAHLSIDHGIKGPSMTVTTACSSGGDAIGLAKMFINASAADAMVVMAGEGGITTGLIQSLTKTGALSKTGESRPFDAERNGFVLGEGGGALVLETEESALKRGAKIYAALLGTANNADAYNPVSPEPDGAGAARCMELALEDAGLEPDMIGYINAHGTATSMGDVAETNAIKKVFGTDVPVSSTKGMTGHMMGAGGILEVITCIEAVNSGVLPVNVGMQERDPECNLNIVTDENKKRDISAAMSNAFGFGGQNSSVIVGKYKAV